MSNRTGTGMVYLVGAGPGDPGLLTARTIECLLSAHFILYDYLTSPRVRAFFPANARTMCADELPGEHPQRWQAIHERIIAEARQGNTVVHLKGGDPLIFGRGGEEAEALRQAGVAYEIVPGVTAALAAGAYAEIPLTHRNHASAVAFITGHEHPGKPNSRLNWDNLAHFPGTLVFYMGVARLGSIAQELVSRGLSRETPAAMVHHASSGRQRTVVATLDTIEVKVREAGLTAPALLIVGSVVDLKPEQSWFEAKPLLGKAVLITRPGTQAQSLARRIENLGGIPEVLPVIDVAPPADWADVDQKTREIQANLYDWLVFTSANGVRAFFHRLLESGNDIRILGQVKLAAIGAATARCLAEFHLIADVAPTEEMNSERLTAVLSEKIQGARVLLAQAEEGRQLLRNELSQIAKVDLVSVYRQVVVLNPSDPVMDRIRSGEIDVVTLTSPNIARAFLEGCDESIKARIKSGLIQLLVNSERLKLQLESEGFPSIAAKSPTEDGLVQAISEMFAQ